MGRSGEGGWVLLTCDFAIDQIFRTMFIQRKFRVGICCGGYLAIRYGGEVLYLRIFS